MRAIGRFRSALVARPTLIPTVVEQHGVSRLAFARRMPFGRGFSESATTPAKRWYQELDPIAVGVAVGAIVSAVTSVVAIQLNELREKETFKTQEEDGYYIAQSNVSGCLDAFSKSRFYYIIDDWRSAIRNLEIVIGDCRKLDDAMKSLSDRHKKGFSRYLVEHGLVSQGQENAREWVSAMLALAYYHLGSAHFEALNIQEGIECLELSIKSWDAIADHYATRSEKVRARTKRIDVLVLSSHRGQMPELAKYEYGAVLHFLDKHANTQDSFFRARLYDNIGFSMFSFAQYKAGIDHMDNSLGITTRVTNTYRKERFYDQLKGRSDMKIDWSNDKDANMLDLAKLCASPDDVVDVRPFQMFETREKAERVRLFIRKCFETKVNLLFLHALSDGQVSDALNALYNEIVDGGHVMANIDGKWASSSGRKRLHSVLAVLLLLDSSSSAESTKHLETCLASDRKTLKEIVEVFDTDPCKRATGHSYRRHITWDLVLAMVNAIHTKNEAEFVAIGELLLRTSKPVTDGKGPYTDFRALRTWMSLFALNKLTDETLRRKGEELVAQCSEIFGPDPANSKPQGHKLTLEDLDKVATLMTKYGK